jgi:hypothetical protein
VIFDYQSKTDFKFAGVDIALNKFVMGHRTAAGWVVDVQTPLQVKPDTNYNVLVAVNGTAVTVSVDGTKAFTYNFPAHVFDGVTYALNTGLVGMGSQQSRGIFDNVAVQILPPQISYDSTETFDDGVANQYKTTTGATWTDVASGGSGRYNVTAPTGGYTTSIVDLGLGHGLQYSSYLELQAKFSTRGMAGITFDRYAANDFKFAAIDVIGQRIVIGHQDPRRGFFIDRAVSRALTAGTDYTMLLTLKGFTAAVSVNGIFAFSFVYNANVVDGAFGVFAMNGISSFDSTQIKTNDPAWISPTVIIS